MMPTPKQYYDDRMNDGTPVGWWNGRLNIWPPGVMPRAVIVVIPDDSVCDDLNDYDDLIDA